MATKTNAKVIPINAVQAATRNAAELIKVTGTAKERQNVIMLKQFPNKAAYLGSRADGGYKAFMSGLKSKHEKGSKTTTAYMYATAWLKATYGGLLSADGKIVKPGQSNGKGMTAGRWLAALAAKFDALVSYLPQAPKADIEPAMLARITTGCAGLADLLVDVEAYRAAAEVAKAAEVKIEVKATKGKKAA